METQENLPIISAIPAQVRGGGTHPERNRFVTSSLPKRITIQTKETLPMRHDVRIALKARTVSLEIEADTETLASKLYKSLEAALNGGAPSQWVTLSKSVKSKVVLKK